jgi:RNA polymerase sigma-70 factor (ECF subfamily)
MMNHELETSMTDKWVILLAKQGNESAFRELYESNYEMIYRLAYWHSKSQEDAEDIMQETFIKAFKDIDKFNFDIGSNFSAWIYQIGFHCSMDYLRKRKKRKADQTESLTDIPNEPEALDSSPEKFAIANQIIYQVKNALNLLSPEQRIIFDLRHLQHQPVKEISDRLQCSQSTVKKQLQRAILKLRNQLEPLWREE